MPNTLEKRLLRAACFLFVGGLLWAGCQSRSANISAPAPLATPPPVSGQPVPDTLAAEASAADARHFNVLVTAAGSGPADTIRQAVEGRLAAGGFQITTREPDLTVRLAVRTSEFDRTGNYLRYEGAVEAGVNLAWDNRRLGFETLSARGQRGLGEEEAMRKLTSELAEAASAFVLRVAQPAQSGLAAMDVTLQLPKRGAKSPEYAAKFIPAVKQQRGIVYCALVAGDEAARTLVFRIVYLADAVPEGLLNRLATLPELPLKLRP